jgi:hypothetical protein
MEHNVTSGMTTDRVTEMLIDVSQTAAFGWSGTLIGSARLGGADRRFRQTAASHLSVGRFGLD